MEQQTEHQTPPTAPPETASEPTRHNCCCCSTVKPATRFHDASGWVCDEHYQDALRIERNFYAEPNELRKNFRDERALYVDSRPPDAPPDPETTITVASTAEAEAEPVSVHVPYSDALAKIGRAFEELKAKIADIASEPAPDAETEPDVMDCFWIVVRDQRDIRATARHETEESARQEAERLARTVGGRFFVFALRGAVEVCKPVRWQEATEVVKGPSAPSYSLLDPTMPF